jgi:hypothetical protein
VTDPDLDELAATCEPLDPAAAWRATTDADGRPIVVDGLEGACAVALVAGGGDWPRAVAEYIATFDPPTVEWLIAKARRAEALDELLDGVRAALQPGRWRGFDGPDGVTHREVVDDVIVAVRAFDAAVTSDGEVDRP